MIYRGFFIYLLWMVKIKIIALLISICFGVFAQRVRIPNQHAQSFVRFTENKKQWDSNIRYKAELDGGALFIEQSENLPFIYMIKTILEADI